MDTEKSNYPDHLEDIEPDDYILDDTLSSWNREKKPIWKRLVTGSEAPFILMGIGLVVVIILFFLFAPKGDSDNTRQQLVQLSGRIQQLDQKISMYVAMYDAALKKLPVIEKEIESIQKKTNRLESMDVTAALRIDRVVKDFKILKNEIKSQVSKDSKSAARPPSGISTKKRPSKKLTSLKKQPQPAKKQAPAVESKPAPKQTDAVYHIVKKGETLYRIGLQHGVSVESIYQINGLKKGSAIYPGQKLVIKPPIVE